MFVVEILKWGIKKSYLVLDLIPLLVITEI